MNFTVEIKANNYQPAHIYSFNFSIDEINKIIHKTRSFSNDAGFFIFGMRFDEYPDEFLEIFSENVIGDYYKVMEQIANWIWGDMKKNTQLTRKNSRIMKIYVQADNEWGQVVKIRYADTNIIE